MIAFTLDLTYIYIFKEKQLTQLQTLNQLTETSMTFGF